MSSSSKRPPKGAPPAKPAEPQVKSRSLFTETTLVVGLIAMLLSPFYQPIAHRLHVLGITRGARGFENIHGAEGSQGIRSIPNTAACEDLHHHQASGLLFAGCQGDLAARHAWFPPLLGFNLSGASSQGKIVVVDPKTFTARDLEFSGFQGPFNPHGIDVITAEDPSAVYIWAISHLANPAFNLTTASSEHHTQSQVELFRHTLGSSTAEYVRSIRHPLIQTPNDILATSTSSFYISNDHHYRKGGMRIAEDLLSQYLAPWTNVMHVQISDLSANDPEAGLDVQVAITGLHNSNGLGRVEGFPGHEDELMIVDASGGVLTRTFPKLPEKDDTVTDTGASSKGSRLQQLEQVVFDSCLDNPSWYNDEYASSSGGRDSSGIIVPGLTKGFALADDWNNPSKPLPGVVWHATQIQGKKGPEWQKRALFQDDGHKLRSVSAAVLIGIDPKDSGGRKQGWLFATGFVSENIIVAKVDL